MTNRSKLQAMMRENAWSMEDVARIAMVSRHTVQAWLRPSTNKAHRNVRAQCLMLLQSESDRMADMIAHREKTKA